MRALKKKNILVLCLLFVLGALALTLPSNASISPTELAATLRPCESITETKTVHIEAIPPRADVVFAFDLTGSMGGILSTAKNKAQDIMDKLDLLGIDIQYGVMSYMDYPHTYSSCGYSATYGDANYGDYAYSLDQAVTSDGNAVKNAIVGLTTGSGWDGPEDYTRIMYESYADPCVAWRGGAKRILVNFGDDVPHDCNLNEGVTSGTWSTGRDPGRNEVVDGYPPGGDDLKLLDVLQGMSDNGVTLLECHTADWTRGGLSIVDDYWDYWTGITGGDVYLTDSNTLVDDVNMAVTAALTTPMVYGLHLEASSGFESWVSSEPNSYDRVEPCHEVTFQVTIHVPEGTEDGVYTFTISAMDEDGVSYGDQSVTITVVTTIPVSVDIKPGSCPNPLNIISKGMLPVAILGSEDFDVTTIDVATILLAGVAPIRSNYEDVAAPVDGDECECTTEGPDGYLDLTLKFKTQEIVDALGEVVNGDNLALTLTGELSDGTRIEGADCIRVKIPKAKKPKK